MGAVFFNFVYLWLILSPRIEGCKKNTTVSRWVVGLGQEFLPHQGEAEYVDQSDGDSPQGG